VSSGGNVVVPVVSERARRVEQGIGIVALVGTVATVWLGLWVTPPDQVQGDLVRLVYLHPGVAWVALYLAFGLAAVSSLLYLWPRTRSLFWDRLAAAAVEVGVVFNACTLISGSIWGKPTWGVWWAWDARLTSTAVLLVLFLGYLALRRVPAEPEVRAKRSAFVALFAAVDIPIVHFSVLWWRTLHQGATVLNPDLSPTIHGSMAWTLLLGFVSLTLVFVWMLLVRYRIGALEDALAGRELDAALRERRAEGDSEGGRESGADGGVGAAADERTLAALGHPGEEPVAVDAASASSLPEGVR
jgi:heme exporter protein C